MNGHRLKAATKEADFAFPPTRNTGVEEQKYVQNVIGLLFARCAPRDEADKSAGKRSRKRLCMICRQLYDSVSLNMVKDVACLPAPSRQAKKNKIINWIDSRGANLVEHLVSHEDPSPPRFLCEPSSQKRSKMIGKFEIDRIAQIISCTTS